MPRAASCDLFEAMDFLLQMMSNDRFKVQPRNSFGPDDVLRRGSSE